MPFFFLYLDLFEIRLKVMLSDFAEKKETFFDLRKENSQSPKHRIFSKGLTHALVKKNANFSFV